MLLTHAELQRLVELKQRTPHELLGMHTLADGAGVVVRAFVPDAAKVEVQPTHEQDKPAIKLTRLHKAGVFEGVTTEANRIYAYDLVITDQQGRVRRTRDHYSFLPTLGDSDLFLFGKGDERRIYEKLGAQLRTLAGSHGLWGTDKLRLQVLDLLRSLGIGTPENAPIANALLLQDSHRLARPWVAPVDASGGDAPSAYLDWLRTQPMRAILDDTFPDGVTLDVRPLLFQLARQAVLDAADADARAMLVQERGVDPARFDEPAGPLGTPRRRLESPIPTLGGGAPIDILSNRSHSFAVATSRVYAALGDLGALPEGWRIIS